MVLSSVTYLIFLTITVFLYYIFPVSQKKYILILFSFIFYAWVMPFELIVVFVFAVTVFFLGKYINKYSLIIGILLSVIVLFVYKYLKPVLMAFNLGEGFSLIAPVGISYISFQCISYLVERKKEKIKAMSFADYILYIFFFAKITAGPIERAESFCNMTFYKYSFDNLKSGLFLIATGFIKKIVVADLLAIGVNNVYKSFDTMDGLSVLLGVIGYSFQIYTDFSGYTDIARGSARLLGIELTENFNTPYLAESVGEFWRRWHISLSTWLKNYIYIPLGGSRTGVLKRYRNVLATFLVSGIWHGAALTFVLWGLLHGVFQIVELLFKPLGKVVREKLHISEEAGLIRALKVFKTFVLVTFSWIFFRAESINQAFLVIKNLFKAWENPTIVMESLDYSPKILIVMLIGIIALIILKEYKKRADKPQNYMVVIATVGAIWLSVSAGLVTFGTEALNTFIYFNF